MTETQDTLVTPHEVRDATELGRDFNVVPVHELGSLVAGDALAEQLIEPVERVGILKKIASYDGARDSRYDFDGLEFRDDEQDLDRKIRAFAGKKNKQMQTLLSEAIGYIAQNPQGDGSATIKGLDKGQGTPIYNHERIQLWRFKPNDANGLPHNHALRPVRIVYSVVELEDGQKALGILDIINRGDLAKKYH